MPKVSLSSLSPLQQKQKHELSQQQRPKLTELTSQKHTTHSRPSLSSMLQSSSRTSISSTSMPHYQHQHQPFDESISKNSVPAGFPQTIPSTQSAQPMSVLKLSEMKTSIGKIPKLTTLQQQASLRHIPSNITKNFQEEFPQNISSDHIQNEQKPEIQQSSHESMRYLELPIANAGDDRDPHHTWVQSRYFEDPLSEYADVVLGSGIHYDHYSQRSSNLKSDSKTKKYSSNTLRSAMDEATASIYVRRLCVNATSSPFSSALEKTLRGSTVSPPRVFSWDLRKPGLC